MGSPYFGKLPFEYVTDEHGKMLHVRHKRAEVHDHRRHPACRLSRMLLPPIPNPEPQTCLLAKAMRLQQQIPGGSDFDNLKASKPQLSPLSVFSPQLNQLNLGLLCGTVLTKLILHHVVPLDLQGSEDTWDLAYMFSTWGQLYRDPDYTRIPPLVGALL